MPIDSETRKPKVGRPSNAERDMYPDVFAPRKPLPEWGVQLPLRTHDPITGKIRRGRPTIEEANERRQMAATMYGEQWVKAAEDRKAALATQRRLAVVVAIEEEEKALEIARAVVRRRKQSGSWSGWSSGNARSDELTDALLVAQSERCAICGKAPTEQSGPGSFPRFLLDVANDGSVAPSVLCWRCHTALGLWDRDDTVMEAAATYIRTRDA